MPPFNGAAGELGHQRRSNRLHCWQPYVTVANFSSLQVTEFVSEEP